MSELKDVICQQNDLLCDSKNQRNHHNKIKVKLKDNNKDYKK
jgi:hypothetical protein